MIAVNGIPVLAGSISFPVSGTWVARLAIAQSKPQPGSTKITDGTDTLVGYTVRSNLNGARTVLSVIGGAGGLASTSPAAHYKGAKVSKVLADICSDTGESPSMASDSSITGETLPFWSAPAGTGGQSLTLLSRQLSTNWGVDRDGKILLGYDEGDESRGELEILESDFGQNKYIVAPDGIELRPGMLQQEQVVTAVEYKISEKVRAIYWL